MTQIQDVDADLTCKMKRYHKRTKTSLCDSLFWSSRCVHTDCLYFHNDGYKRAEQTLVVVVTEEEGGEITQGTHTRARTERYV